jgi:hypothetical protein
LAVLRPGAPLAQSGPTLRIDNRLAPGEHVFALVVTDDAGLESAPAMIRVLVRPAGAALDPPAPWGLR